MTEAKRPSIAQRLATRLDAVEREVERENAELRARVDRFARENTDLRAAVTSLVPAERADVPPIGGLPRPPAQEGRQFSTPANAPEDSDPTYDAAYMAAATQLGPGSREARAALRDAVNRLAADPATCKAIQVQDAKKELYPDRAAVRANAWAMRPGGWIGDSGPAADGIQVSRAESPWEDDPWHSPEFVARLGVHTAPKPDPYNPEPAPGTAHRSPAGSLQRAPVPIPAEGFDSAASPPVPSDAENRWSDQ